MNTIHIMPIWSRFQFRSDRLYACLRMSVAWLACVGAVSGQV
jgi:hypothetical protein